jgi:hypothetical protein
MHGDSIWKRKLSREQARWFFQQWRDIDRLEPDELAAWKKHVRAGSWDPWQRVIDAKRAKE